VSARRTRRRARRVVRLSAAVGLPVTVALTFGGAVAGAVVVLGALVWALGRWPRWEARVFEPSRAVELHSHVWAPPHDPRASDAGLGPEGHRAFAQALHALTGAYLAECEREAER
jgi:hypothetical protein